MAKDRPATHAAGDARSAPKQRGAVGPLGTVAKTPSPESHGSTQGPLYTLYDKETGEVFLMQNGRLVQFIQVIFRIGKVDQLLHDLWQQLVRKPLSAFLTAVIF